jgi:hypothetical protein
VILAFEAKKLFVNVMIHLLMNKSIWTTKNYHSGLKDHKRKPNYDCSTSYTCSIGSHVTIVYDNVSIP